MGMLYYLTSASQPNLVVLGADETQTHLPFTRGEGGREPDEHWWQVDLSQLPAGVLRFQVALGDGQLDIPEYGDCYETLNRTLWLQDAHLFDYQPPGFVAGSTVLKIDGFGESLPPRALYIYLPRGYDDNPERFYPVLYMHDGQNCFESYAGDSYAGTWHADDSADWLIQRGVLPEIIIVGVSHGGERRIAEYSPPYIKRKLPKRMTAGKTQPLRGNADQTAAFYKNEVAPYIQANYRVQAGREQTAVCGSSMGGLFSLYLAWAHTDFAKHYGVVSPALWLTRPDWPPLSKAAAMETVRNNPKPDVRIWLDSGTFDSPGRGNDDQTNTTRLRDALLQKGFKQGQDLFYLYDEGATHSEAAWAARLPEIFQYLFPIEGV